MFPCDKIATLWGKLNPHMTVEGCVCDPTGKVTIYVWYWRFDVSKNRREVLPLAFVLGRPPGAVIRVLENASRLIIEKLPAAPE